MSKALTGGNKVITSIMREQIGIDDSLGELTLQKKESWYTFIRKGLSFIQRNIAKREGGASEDEIKTALKFLFFVEDGDINLRTDKVDDSKYLEFREKYHQLELKIHPDFKGRERTKELRRMNELKKEDEEIKEGESISLAKQSFENRGEEPLAHGKIKTGMQGKDEIVNFFISQPNRIVNKRNGAIYNYKGVENKLFVISLDRIVAMSIYFNILDKYLGFDSLDKEVRSYIIYYMHRAMPQHKSNRSKSWGYNLHDIKLTREESVEVKDKAEKLIKKAFMRAYRSEINIKSMEDYERNLGRTVATSFDTKKNIPPKIVEEMKNSKFLDDRFSYVELDEDTDIEKYKVVEQYYLEAKKIMIPIKLTALRFRKLGKHRVAGQGVAGLYSPFHQAIAIDIRHSYSFIHEYGHAIDYLLEEDIIQSLKPDFTEIIDSYSNFLTSGVTGSARNYYLTPTEVFARAYEVAFRNKYPNLQTGLILPLEKLKSAKEYSPFYKNEDFYNEVIDYMGQYI